MFTLRIDGKDYPKDNYNDLKDAEITLRREDENGTIAHGFSQGIKLYKDAYNYVYAKLITDPNGLNNEVTVDVYDECCQKFIFNGKITSQHIDWCFGTCELSCDLVEAVPDYLTCLQRTRIYDDKYGFKSQKHPFVPYCLEIRPNLLQDIWTVMGFLLLITTYMLTPVFFLLELVVNVAKDIAALFSGNWEELKKVDTTIINAWKEIIAFLQDYIYPCGYGHPAPLIRDYLQNVCKVCDIQLESPVFTNPSNDYYNALWLYAPVKPGKRNEDPVPHWVDENKPLETGESFLNMICQIFNMKYKLNGNKLILARKDYFLNTETWIDARDIKKLRQDGLCYTNTTTPQPAAAKFTITPDGIDMCGDEAAFQYNDMMDWNLPFPNFPRLQGMQTTLLPFAPTRFRNDGIDRDVLTFWYGLFGDVLNLIGVTPRGGQNDVLILSSGVVATAKVLIWDGKNVDDAKIVRSVPLTSEPQTFNYNTLMWVAAFNDSELSGVTTSKPFISPNLYENFWAINDPRKSIRKGYDFTLIVDKTCELIDSLSFDKIVLLPEGGRGEIKEVTIKSGTLEIKGTV